MELEALGHVPAQWTPFSCQRQTDRPSWWQVAKAANVPPVQISHYLRKGDQYWSTLGTAWQTYPYRSQHRLTTGLRGTLTSSRPSDCFAYNASRCLFRARHARSDQGLRGRMSTHIPIRTTKTDASPSGSSFAPTIAGFSMRLQCSHCPGLVVVNACSPQEEKLQNVATNSLYDTTSAPRHCNMSLGPSTTDLLAGPEMFTAKPRHTSSRLKGSKYENNSRHNGIYASEVDYEILAFEFSDTSRMQ